ncbi:Concanavalin A-like lectin/glucanase domain containing protein [Quillaja saponaria]|uniref:Concanavalin A-like lectin/glucanase domain containing protein n=1 Tax=Quillaja saponaria TaxID=32244 RepID=A0AAD7LHX3_QUISA|nr:Concanavalin A-like lectin/glucanase domain containing protein [Quillaja saponaria]
MVGRIHVAVVAAIIGALTTLLIVFLWRWCCYKRGKDFVEPAIVTRTASLQAGIAGLHQQPTVYQQFDLESKSRRNYYAFRRGVSTKPLFSWADHPSLVTDAVENGWSRFAFMVYNAYMSSPSKRSTLLGLCTVGDRGRETVAEISWELCQGSSDFLQKIRLNPGLKRVNVSNSYLGVASVIRTALPLPGPPLGNCPFPQEAYFEITIMCSRGDDCESVRKMREGEMTKLFQENSNAKANSEASVHVNSNNKVNKIEELKLDGKDWGKGESVMFSLGLTAGGSLPRKTPGSYPGSIGFNSDGSLYLDGIKHVFESENSEWGRTAKVIGCGFDPRQKKVFFTLDSQLVHVIHCISEEFGAPLYPTLGSNIDILVLVNFGQNMFKYAPANTHRTPNPCFIGPLVNPPTVALGYEDSKELFSMGRIDSLWLNSSTAKGSHNHGSNNRSVDFDDESETDLFEIVLDGSERSPNTVLQH